MFLFRYDNRGRPFHRCFNLAMICLCSIVTHFSVLAAEVVSVAALKKDSRRVQYQKVHDKTQLHFAVFPIASSKASTWEDPVIPESFVFSLANGRVYSDRGLVLFNGALIKEFIWPWSKLNKAPATFDVAALPPVKRINGRVAVIAQEGYRNYYHWITEVLPRFALLAQKKMTFDWLYVPKLEYPFMRQTLELMGVDPNKIIEADTTTHIEAAVLIVPSFASRSCYTPDWIVRYLRQKLLPAAAVSARPFAKKVFISRRKASYRRVSNEDAVFSLLAPLGFVRYHLEDLTFPQQVALFKQAEQIISPHGAGLTNLIFATPGAKVIELFQHHEDDTYWYLSQTVGLRHQCIKTAEFEKGGGYTDTVIPLATVEKALQNTHDK